MRLAGFFARRSRHLAPAQWERRIAEEMAAQREKFLAGCAIRKVPAKKAEKIFRSDGRVRRIRLPTIPLLRVCALAYQTAYLKTHYPVEFMAALLTSETGNTRKL